MTSPITGPGFVNVHSAITTPRRLAANPTSLLPASENGAELGGDPMAMLGLAMAKLASNDAASSEAGVRLTHDKVKQLREDIKEARRKAAEDAHKGGFLDDLTNNTGIMGAIGLATFCPELVAADLLLHATGADKKLDSEDNVMIAGALTGGGAVAAGAAVTIAARKSPIGENSRLGGDDHLRLTDEKVHPALEYLWAADLAIVSLAATGATFGSGTPLTLAIIAVALSGAAMAVDKTKCMDGVTGDGSSKYWALGLQGAAIATSLGSSFLAPTGVAATGSRAKDAADVLNGGSQAASGADKIERAANQHDADLMNIAATKGDMNVKRHERVVSMIIDGIKEAKQSHEKVMKSLYGAIDTNYQTLSTAAGVKA